MSGNTQELNSGYTGKLTDESEFNENAREWPDAKYYDLYITTDTTTACNGKPCKGHALDEVAGWYGDWSNMVATTTPWFQRSGFYSNTTIAGVFSFSRWHGEVANTLSFRIVLTPNN